MTTGKDVVCGMVIDPDTAGQPWRMDRQKIRERAEVVKKYDKDNPTGL